ncbi:MAG: helix-turn-helix domain-containing protein [Sulfuricaulis sp.]
MTEPFDGHVAKVMKAIDPLCVEIGKRIREERVRLGLTQTEFAAAGGVSLSSQGAYEKGTRAGDCHYLVGISRAGVDPIYVVTGRRIEQVDGIDWQLYDKVVETISKTLAADRLEIPSGKTAPIVRLVYGSAAAANGRIDQEQVRLVLRLACPNPNDGK